MRLIALLLAAIPLTAAPALDRTITRLMREGDVPGLSIVVIQRGEVRWHRAFGVANAETRQPLTENAIFESASLSKPVLAYAVLKLADAGVFSLDTPLSEYLPELAADARLKRITGRMALTHTTGLPNEVRAGETLKVRFDPGARFSYSGAGYLSLQRAVERVTNQSLPALMRELVFEPLRMRDTHFAWLPADERRKVYGHSAAGTVRQRRRPAEPSLAMMHTTTMDYARFVIAIMNGTGLKSETIRAMLTAQVETGAKGLSWGLGWGLEQTERGKAFFHWGENNGDTQHFVIAYPDGSGLVIFTNSGNGLTIIPEIATAALGSEHPAFAWMGYDTYKSPPKVVLRETMVRGARAALLISAAAALNEKQINQIGYILLERKRIDDAIVIFGHNVQRFPDSSNAYDSLGEAYAAKDDLEKAIANYQRSLELNPENTNAVQMLQKLRSRPRS